MAKRTAKTASRSTAKKTTKKRTQTRRTTAVSTKARAAAPARKPAKITGAKGKARTKSEVYTIISDHVGISKKEVAQVFDVMGEMIAADLKKGNIGVFKVPGMMQVSVRRKPATKARKGINPFTKEPTVFKAKPATNVVKIRPLAGLKKMV